MRRHFPSIGLVALACAGCGGATPGEAGSADPQSAPPGNPTPQVPVAAVPVPPRTRPAVSCPVDASVPSLAPIDAAAALTTTDHPAQARGGPSCAGISPPADVPMRAHVRMPQNPCSLDCRPGSSDEGGLLAFAYAVHGSTCHAGGVDLVPAEGAAGTRRSSVGLHLEPYPQPSGFMVAARSYLGPGWNVVSTWDASARLGTPLEYQASRGDPRARYGRHSSWLEASAPNPLGGAAFAGTLRLSVDASFQHSALMFAPGPEGTELRWGPTPLDSDGTVLGIGVDVLGRSLVLTDGASLFGDGYVAAQWFGDDGAALTCAFPLLERFAAPEATDRPFQTWLEAIPLAGGGLAVRRVDETSDASYRLVVTKRYVAVVEGGVARFAAAPDWMRALGGATLQLVRGGGAYAVLHEGGTAAPCTQRLDVLAPDGTSCATREYPIAAGTCTTLPLTVGADGTVIQQLPTALEPRVGSVDRFGVFSACTWRWWTGALR